MAEEKKKKTTAEKILRAVEIARIRAERPDCDVIEYPDGTFFVIQRMEKPPGAGE